MKNQIEEVKIEKDISEYIESLMYEVNARKDLLSFCMTRGIDMDNEIFKRYHDEYTDFFVKFEIAKEEYIGRYIQEKFPNSKWNLNFRTNTVTVEVL